MSLVPVQVHETLFSHATAPLAGTVTMTFRPRGGIRLDPALDRSYVPAVVKVEVQGGEVAAQLLTVNDEDEPLVEYDVELDLGRGQKPIRYPITLPAVGVNDSITLELSDRDETTGLVPLPSDVPPASDSDEFGDVF